MEVWPKHSANKHPRPMVLEKGVEGETRSLDSIATPEEFIQNVDFDIVNEIFDLLEKKAGVVEGNNTGHRVRPEQVTFVAFKEGEASRELGIANVSTGKISLKWDSDPRESRAGRALNTLHTLIHEATHVRGGYQQTVPELIIDEQGTLVRLEGYVRTALKENRIVTHFPSGEEVTLQNVSLNEAVTENIAHEVFAEYLQRTGNSGYLADSRLHSELGYGSYLVDRLLLELFLGAVARTLEVSRDDVWRGVVRAYMTADEEVRKLFETLGDLLLEEDAAVAELLPELLASTESSLTIGEVDAHIGTNPHFIGPFARLARRFSPTYLHDVLKLS